MIPAKVSHYQCRRPSVATVRSFHRLDRCRYSDRLFLNDNTLLLPCKFATDLLWHRRSNQHVSLLYDANEFPTLHTREIYLNLLAALSAMFRSAIQKMKSKIILGKGAENVVGRSIDDGRIAVAKIKTETHGEVFIS